MKQNNFISMVNVQCLLIAVGFALVAFFTFSHLTESPATWMDEGIVTQVSRNIAEFGRHAIQVAPGELVSAGFVSTGYPATFPVAVSLRVFGEGILQARSMMALFIITLVILVYLFIRKSVSPKAALASLFLIASFAPLYGHGKNVLGEIPGLTYLFGAFLALYYLERREPQKPWMYISAGILCGLAVVTKPIFLLLLPAFLVALIIHRKRGMNIAKKMPWNTLLFFLGGVGPCFIWLFVQFQGDSFGTMFQIYANPHNVQVASSILTNLKRFVTEAQPFYTLILLVLWKFSIIKRVIKKQSISFVETFVYLFSCLIILAYLRTVGYYRYFFLAEFIALAYLPQSLSLLWPKKIPKAVYVVGITLLVLFQLYQTQFTSFVAEAVQSTRSHDLETFAKSIPNGQTVFVYQAPELVPFLKTNNYYQYMDVTTSIHIGMDVMPILLLGKADIVFVGHDAYIPDPERFARYGNVQRIDRYDALYKIK